MEKNRFHLQNDLHTSTFGRVQIRGLKEMERYQSFILDRGDDCTHYELDDSDIAWVLGIIREDISNNPDFDHTATSLDILLTTWENIDEMKQ